jgi:nucleotide-binding universal stress UspA family protein
LPDPKVDARAAIALRHHVRDALGAHGCDARLELEHGSPEDGMLRLASTHAARMLVVAASEKSALERALLGSTANALVRHAPCPVLVARDAPREGPVVLATDLADPSLAAEREAAVLARALHRSLVLVHVLDLFRPVAATFDPATTVDARTVEALRDAATALATSCLERVGATARRVIEVGDPVRTVLDEARREGASLIVLSSHGREGLARLAHGSTVEAVVRDASCSVLVTHRHAN